MSVTAKCPGCGKQVTASDRAAGRKAKCPDCGAVIDFSEEGGAEVSDIAHAAAALARSSTPAEVSPVSAATTVDRMLARTSPYGALRLLAVISFGVGIGLAILCFVGGLAALIVMSMRGSPAVGVAAFVGALVLTVLLVLCAKTGNELLHLAADVGDRTRQTSQVIEEFLNRQDEDLP